MGAGAEREQAEYRKMLDAERNRKVRPMSCAERDERAHNSQAPGGDASSCLTGSPRGSLASAIRGVRVLSPRDGAGRAHSEAFAMLSSSDRDRYADRMRTAIIEHVLSTDCAERSLVLSLPQPLKPPPPLADCDFPPEGEMAGAEETMQLLKGLQEAAKKPDADDCEKQLVEGLCDYLSCICEQLRKCPKTELAAELDESISCSVRQRLLPAIRDFSRQGELAANTPQLAELDQHLTAVQEAECECALMADVRGRKLALNKVWDQLLASLVFARDAYGRLIAPSASMHGGNASGAVDALQEVLEQLRNDTRQAHNAVSAAQQRCDERASSLERYAARGAQQVEDLKDQVQKCEDEAMSLRQELEAEVDAIVAHIAPRLPALRALHERAHESGNVASTLRKHLASCEATWGQHRERVQEGERRVAASARALDEQQSLVRNFEQGCLSLLDHLRRSRLEQTEVCVWVCVCVCVCVFHACVSCVCV